MTTDAPELVTPGDLGDELASFIRAMRANNVSPNTILAYGGAVRQFGQVARRARLPDRRAADRSATHRGMDRLDTRALQAGDRPQPLPRAPAVLQLVRDGRRRLPVPDAQAPAAAPAEADAAGPVDRRAPGDPRRRARARTSRTDATTSSSGSCSTRAPGAPRSAGSATPLPTRRIATSTSAARPCGFWAKAARTTSSRSATRPCRRSTTTSGSGASIRTRTSRGCGSASAAS